MPSYVILTENSTDIGWANVVGVLHVSYKYNKQLNLISLLSNTGCVRGDIRLIAMIFYSYSTGNSLAVNHSLTVY